ncbi:hypothetical protein Tco_1464096 [Tanacetum coccineum]
MTNTQTPPPATTVVNTTDAPVTNTVANHAERPEKFNGQNFKRWQQKMFFYLTTLGLARFLKETVPQVEPPAEGQSSNAQAVQAVEAWKHSDFLCHNSCEPARPADTNAAPKGRLCAYTEKPQLQYTIRNRRFPAVLSIINLDHLRNLSGQIVKSGCTTALDVVPWETDSESVLRESCYTRASFF